MHSSHILAHRLWVGYMSELLGLAVTPAVPRNNSPSLSSPAPEVMAVAMPRAAEVHPKLVKADLHGSIIMTDWPSSLRPFEERDEFDFDWLHDERTKKSAQEQEPHYDSCCVSFFD